MCSVLIRKQAQKQRPHTQLADESWEGLKKVKHGLGYKQARWDPQN
ncbi:hypothetical protein LEMLEM_LOCUS12241 [Lemmus lemmus]